MQIHVERAALLKGLDRVRSVVQSRNTIPILSNVLLAAREGVLELAATDLDMESRSDVILGDLALAPDSKINSLTVNATQLHDIVRKMPEGAEVSLTYGDDARLQVKAGRSTFKLPVLPAGDFPVFGDDGLGSEFQMEADDLARLLDKTMFAMCTEETRYYLNGVYLHAMTVEGELRMRIVATDGHRLALAEMPAPEGFAPGSSVIIGRKAVKEIRKMIDKEETITLQVTRSKVRVTTGTGVLTTKTIDGNFPDYSRVIPRDNEKVVKVDREGMLNAIDRVATISAEKVRSAKFLIEQGRMVVTVRNMEAGQAVEEIEVDYDGEPFEVGFNARYAMDALRGLDGDSAEFAFADPTSPALVVDAADPTLQFVLMPLRV